MTYHSEIQVFFHPRAFNNSEPNNQGRYPNAPISLTYIADAKTKKPLTTTLRFFLQLLRASLQALPQATTKISNLLGLVSSGWDIATQVAESERRLGIETLTTSRIVGDERLDIIADVLLPKVKTKIRASFALTASIRTKDGSGSGDLFMNVMIEPKVTVVYGELYDEKNMSKYLAGLTKSEGEGWNEAVRSMKEKLIAKGEKGQRK